MTTADIQSPAQAERATTQTLVCFAVREEAAPVAKHVLGRSNVSIVITGIGPRNARRELEGALSRFRPARVFTCGFAGALDPDLKIGTVVFDVENDPGLATRLQVAGARAVRFYCATRVAVTASEKQRLRAATEADAVEMESGVIRSLCRERRIPAATIRVISDAAADDLPLDFNALLDAKDRLSLWKVARALLSSPQSIPSLLRLQRNTRLAAENLARMLAVVIPK